MFMYHGRFRGSHYEAGRRFGAALRKNGRIISHQPTFSITEERSRFAKQCIPVYQIYYPEILEEIRGIAEGQETAAEDMLIFLLSMYCFPFGNHCTCIAISDGAHILFGRNSDFLVELEKLYMNCLYDLEGAYAFNGNTTAFVEMEDGVNEYGLAAGLTFVPAAEIQPGLQAGMLVRLLLEKCKTTEEAVRMLQNIPIASAQTITLADAAGKIAVVECDCRRICRIDPGKGEDFVVATNQFHSAEMTGRAIPNADGWRSQERYETAGRALAGNPFSMELLADILSGKHGFLCQYDRKTGADTVWSVLYDLKRKAVYRAEGNPSRRKYREDRRMRFQESFPCCKPK